MLLGRKLFQLDPLMNSTKKEKEHTAHTLFYLLREITRKQTNLKGFFPKKKKKRKTNSSITTGINTQPKISHNSLTGIFNDKLNSLRL